MENTPGNNINKFFDNRDSGQFYTWGVLEKSPYSNDSWMSFMINFSFWSDEYELNKTNKALLQRFGIMGAYDESTNTFSLKKLKESPDFIFSYYFDFPVSQHDNLEF